MNGQETVVIDADSKVVEIQYKELLNDGHQIRTVVYQTYYRPRLGEMWHFVLPKKQELLSKRMLSFAE